MRKVAALVLCFAAAVVFAHHGPESITIDAAAAKQPPVPFSHEKHARDLVKACDTCHHTQKGLKSDQETKVVKCTTCHLNPKGDVPGMREASLQKNPFHTPGCIDCHRKGKKGPVACTGCHIKKN
ncbi:MAG TPA: cytochrome c3 family protein [Thermoanaerobaculia bacterium]|nr:cytochrome c3 family protein [Thermoanaerobaculia bacterium]